MSIDAILRLRRRARGQVTEPTMLSWRRAVRERKVQERELRSLVRSFSRGA